MKLYDTLTAKVGDKVIVCEDGHPYILTVWRVLPAGSGGRSCNAGPLVSAHIRPGGWGVTFDALSYLGDDVTFCEDTKGN